MGQLIKWRYENGCKRQVCAKCDSPLPGPDACCEKAINASYAGQKAAETAAETGYERKSYGQRLSDGFDILNDE